MRLLTWNLSNEISLTKDLTDSDSNGIPPYVILSHTWGDDSQEITFADIEKQQGQEKDGYQKLTFCGDRAKRDKYQYFWVDTCCIDKDRPSELSEAITSMFRWYRDADKCYVYLSDVSTRKRDNNGSTVWQSSFRTSRWFTRGWTLQELLAPSIVEFFSREGDFLGTKETLAPQIHEITTIPLAALQGTPLSQFTIAERIRWTEGRNTKKKEDQAYCLLGIFNVFIPLLYGEGDYALYRLQKEINERHGADVAAKLGASQQTRSLGLCLKSAPVIKPSDFIGRQHEIDVIHHILQPEEAPIEQQRAVLGGVGGVGKTQIALAYARQHHQSYTSVLWLNATSEATLYTSLQMIAQVLFSATGLTESSNAQMLARTHEWLSQLDNTRWLLIFDNYDEPEEFDLNNFCPNTGHGSVLITTRLPDMVTGQIVRVQPLKDIDHSLTILQSRSGRQKVQQDTGAYRLAQRLDGLPLALVTAGAYLRKSTITFQQYHDLYEQRWQIDHRRTIHLQDYQDRTLYTTWDLSYARLKTEDPDAARMLVLLAYFDHQELWYELFRLGRSERLPDWLQSCLDSERDFESVMGRLVEYCLVEVQHVSRSYRMHSCVHDWTLGALNRDPDPQLYWYAFNCVAASIDRNDWEALDLVKYNRVSQHGIRLAHSRFTTCDEVDGGLLKRVHKAKWIAEMLYEQVQLSAAEQISQRVLAAKEKNFGLDNSSTLDTVHSLGLIYLNQNKLEQAEQMLQRALVGSEKALGPDHTSTLDTVHNLGDLYYAQDKLEAAEQMYIRALVGSEKAIGPDHTSTLSTVHNLGVLYRNQNKLEQAEQMLQRALAGLEKALGLDHTSTLSTVYNLGVVYRNQNKLEQAEQMLQRALAGREKAVGLDHVSTFDSKYILSQVYRQQGRLDQAELM